MTETSDKIMKPDIEQYLYDINKKDLVSIVLTGLKSNRKLHKEIFALAQDHKRNCSKINPSTNNDFDMGSYKTLIDSAVGTIYDCIPELELEEVVNQLRNLLITRNHKELIELVKYFIGNIEEEIDMVETDYDSDDSEEQFGLGSEGMKTYKELALKAWRIAEANSNYIRRWKENLVYIIESIYEYENDLDSLIKFKTKQFLMLGINLVFIRSFKRMSNLKPM